MTSVKQKYILMNCVFIGLCRTSNPFTMSTEVLANTSCVAPLLVLHNPPPSPPAQRVSPLESVSCYVGINKTSQAR